MPDKAEIEAWAKLPDDLRRYPDADLEAEIVWARRELAQTKLRDEIPSLYSEVLKQRISLAEMEQARRRFLSEQRGGPVAQLPKDFPQRIEHVKRSIDIVGIADLLNIHTENLPHNRRLKFRCPIHGDGTDRNPSGMLYLDQWSWWCFGCNSGGSGFDLVLAFQQANTFLGALEWIEKFIPPRVIPKRKGRPPELSFKKVIPDP